MPYMPDYERMQWIEYAIEALKAEGEMSLARFARLCGYSLKYMRHYKIYEIIERYPFIEFDRARNVVRLKGDAQAEGATG